ncbi:U2AF35B [Symbiodinium natans]|uniref:U2AF35B protein n=1 Tax=Symbiodinium natans TaxID=878477 RepID=A0A812QQR1_9DINO|nr:U2AF35B [Symbiodinium natans]
MPVTRVQPVNASEPLEIETPAGSTVADLKLGIEARTGIKASLQRLVAAGRLLQEDALLDSLAGRIFLAQTTGAAAAESPVAPTAETSEIKLLIRAVWSDGRQEERTVDAPKQLPVSRFKEKVLASLDKEFSEEGRCNFVFAGRLLDSEGTLEDQSFEEGDTVVVVAPQARVSCLRRLRRRVVWLLLRLRAFVRSLWALPWVLASGLRTAWYDPWSIVRPSVPEEGRRGPRIRTLGFTAQMARYGPGQNPHGEDLTMVLTQGLLGMPGPQSAVLGSKLNKHGHAESQGFIAEEDRVNCPFYFKIGACRNGDRCNRAHSKPASGNTLLIPHLYPCIPEAMAVANDDEWDDETYARQQEHLEHFYEEVFLELAKFGEVHVFTLRGQI